VQYQAKAAPAGSTSPCTTTIHGHSPHTTRWHEHTAAQLPTPQTSCRLTSGATKCGERNSAYNPWGTTTLKTGPTRTVATQGIHTHASLQPLCHNMDRRRTRTLRRVSPHILSRQCVRQAPTRRRVPRSTIGRSVHIRCTLGVSTKRTLTIRRIGAGGRRQR
jgi:hypothetical protein